MRLPWHPDTDGDYVVYASFADGLSGDIFVFDPSLGDPPYYNLTKSDEREDFPSIEGKTVAFQVWDENAARWYVDIRKLDQDDFKHLPIGDPSANAAFPTVAGDWVFYEVTRFGVPPPGSRGARIGRAKIDDDQDMGTVIATGRDDRAPHSYGEVVAFTSFDSSGRRSDVGFLYISDIMDGHNWVKFPDVPPDCRFRFQPRVGGVDGNSIIFAGYDDNECRDMPLFRYDLAFGRIDKIAELGIDPAGLEERAVVGLLHESRPRYDIAPGENKVVYSALVATDSYEVRTFTW